MRGINLNLFKPSAQGGIGIVYRGARVYGVFLPAREVMCIIFATTLRFGISIDFLNINITALIPFKIFKDACKIG